MTTSPASRLAAPAVPHQRVADRAAAPLVVDVDHDVLTASRQRPWLSLDRVSEEGVQLLLGTLLDARAGWADATTEARAEAVVEHLLLASPPADLVRHGQRVGRLVRALHPERRDALLAELGPVGSPRRALVERLARSGDRAAQAYAV